MAGSHKSRMCTDFGLSLQTFFLIQGLGRRLRRSAAHAHGLWKIADCYYGSASGQGTKLRYYLGNGAPRHCGSPQCPLHTPYTPDLQISRFPDYQISRFLHFHFQISTFSFPFSIFLPGCWQVVLLSKVFFPGCLLTKEVLRYSWHDRLFGSGFGGAPTVLWHRPASIAFTHCSDGHLARDPLGSK